MDEFIGIRGLGKNFGKYKKLINPYISIKQ